LRLGCPTVPAPFSAFLPPKNALKTPSRARCRHFSVFSAQKSLAADSSFLAFYTQKKHTPPFSAFFDPKRPQGGAPTFQAKNAEKWEAPIFRRKNAKKGGRGEEAAPIFRRKKALSIFFVIFAPKNRRLSPAYFLAFFA